MSKIQINAIVFLCLSIGWIAWAGQIPLPEADFRIIEDFPTIPTVIGDWSTRQSDVEYQPEGLPTASVLHRVYKNDRGALALLSIVYGASLGDLHQPEVCLGAQGWSTTDQTKVIITPAGKGSFPAIFSWMRQESSGDERIAVYWFDSVVGKATLLPWHKVKVYWARLRGQSSKGVALVRIMVPITDSEEEARNAMMDFAQRISPHIDTALSKPPKMVKLPS